MGTHAMGRTSIRTDIVPARRSIHRGRAQQDGYQAVCLSCIQRAYVTTVGRGSTAARRMRHWAWRAMRSTSVRRGGRRDTYGLQAHRDRRCNVPLPMKQWQRRNARVINAPNERTPQPVLLLVLRFSDAAGGGRIALTLKKSSAAFPKSRQRTLAAFLLPPRLASLMQHRPPRHCYAACDR